MSCFSWRPGAHELNKTMGVLTKFYSNEIAVGVTSRPTSRTVRACQLAYN